MKQTKTFVPDTNIPIHDPDCLYNFAEHDISIPIPVLTELDGFKKGGESRNYNARDFTRKLEELLNGSFSAEGVSLGAGRGRLKILLNDDFHKKVRENLPESSIDNQIINIAYRLKEKKLKTDPNHEVILVSKDINMRLKARSLGLRAEDYKSDKVDDLKSINRPVRQIEVPSAFIDELYKSEKPLSYNFGEKLDNNEFMVLSVGKKTVLVAHHQGFVYKIKKDEVAAFGITPKNSEQAFAMWALLNPEIPLVTVSGRAGTGKTIIAVATALECLQKKKIEQILFTRQTVAVGDREIGFLPGDVKDKLDPYMQGLHDSLGMIGHLTGRQDKIKSFLKEDRGEQKIIIEPLQYIRGRSLVNKYFIIDEAQNLTPHEVKTIVTRADKGTKIVFTGDLGQIDTPYLDARSNGFSYLINKMAGKKLFAHVGLQRGERSELAELASTIL